MDTLFILFIFFALVVPLMIVAQRQLFKPTQETSDSEWALYEQRYD